MLDFKTAPSPDKTQIVQRCIEALYQGCTTHDCESVAEETLAILGRAFSRYGVRPGRDVAEGLTDLAICLERMACDAEPDAQFFLSSLDPGAGKTSLLVAFIEGLLSVADPDFHGIKVDASVVVFVSRRNEVKTLFDKLKAHAKDVAVYTGDEDINGLTSTPHNEARVLITTQQMVMQHCEGRSFIMAEAFRYRGSPRDVRIWDEGLLPGEVDTLSTDQLSRLLEPTRSLSPDLAAGLEGLICRLKEADAGAVLAIPGLHELGGSGADRLMEHLVSKGESSDATAARTLVQLAGKNVRVFKGAYGVSTVLRTRLTLPRDLAPMVILDASGRARETYRLWEANPSLELGPLKRLRPAVLDYSNLTIRHWETGGSKSSWLRERERLIEGIAKAIEEKPVEEWLVVYHKSIAGYDLKKDLPSLCGVDPKRLHFIHWGDHHGVNDYAHVSNVILAGTLFYPEWVYEGRARLTSGLAADAEVSGGVLNAVREGEHADLILQALCRSAVRKPVDGKCGPCNAYIIASKRSGIGPLLPKVFPRCQVRQWRPVDQKRRGKVAEAISFVKRAKEENREGIVMLNDLKNHLGIPNRSNFNRTIRKHEAFIEAMGELEMEETRLKGSRTPNALVPWNYVNYDLDVPYE